MANIDQHAPRTARSGAHAQDRETSDAVSPDEAFRLQSEGALLIDVRTIEERKHEGYIPGSIHIAWQTGPALIKNPRFFRELEAKASKDAVVLFICRAAHRSSDATIAALSKGYDQALNVLEGADGDDNGGPGWRARGLPWSHD